jgi:AraC family transcriptional regulator, regulatory protein of adaptative response / DNA-3-methyladenine glycosylase II
MVAFRSSFDSDLKGTRMLDPQICEKARLARDPRFDGIFFTGVLSTGIFCRPVCPAPQPKAANVVYFPSAAAAAAAGLRPCLRCRPESAPGTPAWNGTSATAGRAMHLIRQGALNDGNVEALAARLGLGSRQLRRLFQQHIGASPIAMVNTQRLLFAGKLLIETSMPVTQVAFACGFGSIRRFNAAFHQTYGQSPSAFRRQAASRNIPGAAFKCTLTLAYRPPFAWERMLEFYRSRTIPGVEGVDTDGYRRTIHVESGTGLIQVHPASSGHALEVNVELPDSLGLMQVVERVRRMFDLDANMDAIEPTLAADPRMASIVRQLTGMRLPCAWDPFETAVRAIVGQQISVKAARTVLGRIVSRTGTPLNSENPAGLSQCFPTAAAIAEADLQGIGMSDKRIHSLKQLALTVAKHPRFLEIEGSLDAFVQRTTALPGIGPWTAHYIALRGLGEPDAFPAGDLGLAHALRQNGVRPGPKQIMELAEKWRPWRGYAAIYLWHRHWSEGNP